MPSCVVSSTQSSSSLWTVRYFGRLVACGYVLYCLHGATCNLVAKRQTNAESCFQQVKPGHACCCARVLMLVSCTYVCTPCGCFGSRQRTRVPLGPPGIGPVSLCARSVPYGASHFCLTAVWSSDKSVWYSSGSLVTTGQLNHPIVTLFQCV